MRNLIHLLIIITIFSEANAQEKVFGVHGGIGTSWMAMPKTYISGGNDLSSSDFVLSNAKNNVTGFLGVAYYRQIKSSGFYFVPEFNINYVSGEIVLQEVDRTTVQGVKSVRGVQKYIRAELPLIFSVENNDKVGIQVGPIFYANLYNNKVIEEVAGQVSDANVDGSKPLGWAIRVGFSWIVNENLRWTIKWDIDQNKSNFMKFEDDQYKVRLSAQTVTVGFGYFFVKKK